MGNSQPKRDDSKPKPVINAYATHHNATVATLNLKLANQNLMQNINQQNIDAEKKRKEEDVQLRIGMAMSMMEQPNEDVDKNQNDDDVSGPPWLHPNHLAFNKNHPINPQSQHYQHSIIAQQEQSKHAHLTSYIDEDEQLQIAMALSMTEQNNNNVSNLPSSQPLSIQQVPSNKAVLPSSYKQQYQHSVSSSTTPPARVYSYNNRSNPFFANHQSSSDNDDPDSFHGGNRHIPSHTSPYRGYRGQRGGRGTRYNSTYGSSYRGGQRGYNSPRFQRRPNDWDCPKCNFCNFASRRKCRECGTLKPNNNNNKKNNDSSSRYKRGGNNRHRGRGRGSNTYTSRNNRGRNTHNNNDNTDINGCDDVAFKCNKCNKVILAMDWTNDNVKQIHGDKWEHNVCSDRLDETVNSEPVKQLKKFLINIGFEEYFESFKKNGFDVTYIEDFDDETLINDIGITSKLKRKRFLRETETFKHEMDEFSQIMSENNISSKQLKKYGIVTMHTLCDEVKHKMDVKNLFEIDNDLQCDLLWNIIQSQLKPKGEGVVVEDNDYQHEGIQKNANIPMNTPYM